MLLAILVLGYLGAIAWQVQRSTLSLLTVVPGAAIPDPGSIPDDPLARGYRGDPAEAFGYTFQALEIATDLGPAPAWLVGQGGDTAAIYVHGHLGVREGGYRYLSALVSAGIPALLITYRNDPGAPAAPDGLYGFGLTEWRDLQAAASHLTEQGHSRLILIGDSMGAAIIARFLAESPLADRVVGVSLDSPALDLPDIVANLTRGARLPFAGIGVSVGLFMADLRLALDLTQADAIADLSGYAGPMFVAQGSADRLTTLATTLRLVAARQAETIVFQTDTDHLDGYYGDPAGYAAAFARFLDLAAP